MIGLRRRGVSMHLLFMGAALTYLLGIATWSAGKNTKTTPPAAVEDGIALYFSPDGGAADAIVYLIAQARKSVRV